MQFVIIMLLLNNMFGFFCMEDNYEIYFKFLFECFQGLMINDVILNGGMGVGEVFQFFCVSDIQFCIEKCCLIIKCYLVYVI